MDKNKSHTAEQAAAYFARRHVALLAERRSRNAWLDADPSHAQAYADQQRLWDRAGDLADDPELQALKTAGLAALDRRRWSQPRRLITVAASLVVLVGAGLLFSRLVAPEPVAYATVLGEQRTETMTDGTEIVLNTDSAVQVNYSKDRRAVALRQGEAQFEVAHEAARPFVVSVGQDTVTALGTRFQVRRELGSTIVTLLQGSVEIAHGDEHYRLHPDERAVISSRTGVSIAPIDPESAKAWLDGWLRFRGTPLAEVIAEANRYSPRKLRLGDPRLANVQLSGAFRAGDNASIADAASLILPVRVDRSGDELVLQPR
jgi:transmembrane sensor